MTKSLQVRFDTTLQEGGMVRRSGNRPFSSVPAVALVSLRALMCMTTNHHATTAAVTTTVPMVTLWVGFSAGAAGQRVYLESVVNGGRSQDEAVAELGWSVASPSTQPPPAPLASRRARTHEAIWSRFIRYGLDGSPYLARLDELAQIAPDVNASGVSWS